jgi:hypothetical protein
MNNCHHRLFRVLQQAALAVAFSGAIFSGPAQAQTWYLTTNRVWYSHTTSPGNFIEVVPQAFYATFAVPGQGVRFEADWRMPTTITATAISNVPLRVTITGPASITNSVSSPPYMMLNAVGRVGYQDTMAFNGYVWGLWDPGSHGYVLARDDTYSIPINNHAMQGPYAGEDEVPYEIQISGGTWDASGQPMQDEVHVFYYYSRTPTPLVELSNPRPEPSTPLIGGTRTFLVGNLPYNLGNYERADLMLVVEANNTRIAYSERVRIGPANNKVIFNLNTQDFEVPADLPNLRLKALMLKAGSDEVITESSSVTYTIAPAVLMPITLGVVRFDDPDGTSFVDASVGTGFITGTSIASQLLDHDVAFKVQVPQEASNRQRTLKLVLYATSHDGSWRDVVGLCHEILPTGFSGPKVLRPPSYSPTGEPAWQVVVAMGKLRADHLEFFAVLEVRDAGVAPPSILTSPSIHIPVERISWRPTTAPWLVLGPDKARFLGKIEYHTPMPGSRQVSFQFYPLRESRPLEDDVHPFASCPGVNLTSSSETGILDYDQEIPLPKFPGEKGAVYARAAMGQNGKQARSDFDHLRRISQEAFNSQDASETRLLRLSLDSTTPFIHQPSLLVQSRSGILAAAVNGGITKGGGTKSGTPLHAEDVLWLNHTWEFEPPLPADGNFSAMLTLAYDPSMIPDDPGFDENRLTIISYDPQTGQLRSYPTLLDRTNRLASAYVTSLEPFWTLGATPRGSGSVLNYPMLQSEGGFPARLSAVNSGPQPAEVTLTAYDNAGSIISGESITNPVTASLAALQATEWTPASLFNLSSSYQAGWVQLRSTSSGLVGRLRLQTPSRADGIAAGAPTGVSFVMPGLVADTNTACEIYVVNPTVFDGGMELTLIASNGQAVATNSAALPAKGRLTANLTNLFPALSLPFAGYLRAQGDVEMAASALLVRPSSLVALTSQPRPFAGEAATNAWAARYTTGGNALRSQLTLANLATNPITLHLEAVQDNGTVRSVTDLSLPVGSQISDELSHLFGWNLDTESTGSLRVGAPGGSLAGNLQVTDAASNTVAATACPLVTAPARRFVFPYLNQEPDRYIEVSVLNPQPAGVTVCLSVYGTNGALIGTTNLALAAGARLTCPLAVWVPASAGLASGFFLLEAAQPVIAEALAGETSGNTLMAIPATVSVLASNSLAGPAIEIVPAGLGFGTVLVGGSLLRSVEIRNSGTAPLTVKGLACADSHVEIPAPGTPFDLAVGEARMIDLRFTPSSVNLWTGAVTVVSSDPIRQEVVISLAGWGSTPTLDITQEDKHILVSWPAEAVGYQLQTLPNARSLNWTNQPGAPTVISNRMRLIITNDSQQRFFRLAR